MIPEINEGNLEKCKSSECDVKVYRCEALQRKGGERFGSLYNHRHASSECHEKVRKDYLVTLNAL